MKLKNALKQLWKKISTGKRYLLMLLLFLMILTSMLETLSIGSSLPFISFLANPDAASNNVYFKKIINYLDPNSIFSSTTLFTIVFISTTLIAGILRICVLFFTTKLSFSIGADISFQIYKNTLYQPYLVHVSRNSSEIISGVTQKSNSIIYGVIIPILNIINSAILVLILIIPFLLFKPELIIFLVTGLLLIYISIFLYFKAKLSINSNLLATKTISTLEIIQHSLGSIRDILINKSQNFFCNIFKKTDQELRSAESSNILIGQIPKYIVETLGIIFICFLAHFLLSGDESSTSTLPILGALAYATQKILPMMQSAYANITSLKSNIKSLQMVNELLTKPIEISSHKIDSANFDSFRIIRFKDTGFKYSDNSKYIFSHINLQVNAGSIVGITGKSGSGKSTFLDLCLGLLTPTSGQIFIDDKPLNAMNISCWQTVIAHVPQDVYIADSTLVENIAFGIPIPEIDIKRARDCAYQAQLTEIIANDPDGIFMKTGELGGFLSGGQRQRIGIARALYKEHTKLLILDEATSALDDNAARLINNSLVNLANNGYTILMVSHNKSMLNICTDFIDIDSFGAKAN